jgi:hypothetical protein
MASLLNNASLLLNPAGSIIAYEEDKIFSVLPSNGTGDFTFSGGDGGTRVNQQGYIEQTPANLMTYSEDVSNWTGNLFNNWIQSAVTSNSVIAPNGTLTGDRLGDGYGRFNVSATAIPGQTYTYSVYLKNVDLSANFYVYVAWGLNGTLVSYVTAGSQINVSTLSTSEWTRLTFTATAPASGINQMQFGPCPFTGYGTNPAGRKLDVWGGMINIGSTAKPYQPTTDRLNYPRITYQNGRGALLSEPQRTNIVTNSEDATQQGLNNMSATGSTATSPDGTQNADTITPTAGTSDHYLITNVTSVTNGASFTLSAFIKKKDSDYVHFGSGGSGAFGSVAYSFLTNTFFNINGPSAYSVVNFGNGWIRLTITGTTGGTDLRILLTPTDSSGARTFNANGTDGLYIWGLQIEAGSFPTSYIPTTSATVTRPADVSYVNGISSIIGQTQGVLYAQVTPSQLVDGSYICISDNTVPNRLIFGFESGNQALRWYTPYGNSLGGTVVVGQQCKIAAAYNVNDFSIYLNGIQVGSYSSGQLSGTYSHLGLDSYTATSQTFRGTVNNVALFNTRLTNTQLAELTTVRSGSGGNISYYGPYTIHTFTGSATFTPSFTGPVEVLVVAGGGSAGSAQYHSGGGGAGGLLYVSSYGVSQGTSITVTIGAGGAAPTTSITRGNNGSNSVFGGLNAIGGGGGGTYSNATGLNGGSGGGGGAQNGVVGVGGLGIVGQGSNGGDYNGDAISAKNSGGGGGAGQIGQTGTGIPSGGNGGNGLPYSISGFSTYYAGGGGGSTEIINLATTGGLGGGGNGNYDTGQNGVSGLGGGGGAGERYGVATTGAGGSGIVIVRYLT